MTDFSIKDIVVILTMSKFHWSNLFHANGDLTHMSSNGLNLKNGIRTKFRDECDILK